MRLRHLFPAFAFFAVFYGAAIVLAQPTSTVPVTVQVTDPSGAPIPNAHIELLPFPDSAKSELQADQRGQLSLNLKPGGYCAAFSSPGFVVLQGHFDLRGPVTVPVKLSIGGCTECVAVMALDGTSLAVTTLPYRQTFITLSYLRAMRHISLTVRSSTPRTVERYSGVPLSDLLAELKKGQINDPRDQPWADYLVATGANGYKAVLAAAEIDPRIHPTGVLVADALNGKPLDAQSGPFKLVVAKDRNSERFVTKLVSISVNAGE